MNKRGVAHVCEIHKFVSLGVARYYWTCSCGGIGSLHESEARTRDSWRRHVDLMKEAQ